MADMTIPEFYRDVLGWCDCGSPEIALTFMRDVLATMADASDQLGNDRAWEAAKAREHELLPLDSPLALSYRYMLSSLGLTDHGGSVYGSWLTSDGDAALKMLSGDIESEMGVPA